MDKVNQLKHLVTAANMLSKSGICADSPREFNHWWNVVYFAHNQGYLYLGFDKEKELDLVAIGYRIPKLAGNTGEKFPMKEEGTVLYVPLVASKSKDTFKLYKMLKYYMRLHPIDRIAYHWRGDPNDLREKVLHKMNGAREHVKA